MVFPVRFGNMGARVSVLFLLTAFVLVDTSVPRMAFGEEQKGHEATIRTVDSPPPLSEMEKEPGWSYNTDYLFSVSRAVRDSTLPPAGKVPLFIPAIVIDIVLSPFALIGGLFGE